MELIPHTTMLNVKEEERNEILNCACFFSEFFEVCVLWSRAILSNCQSAYLFQSMKSVMMDNTIACCLAHLDSFPSKQGFLEEKQCVGLDVCRSSICPCRQVTNGRPATSVAQA